MTAPRRFRRLTVLLAAALLLGAATTYAVAALLAHFMPVERYRLIPDEDARRGAHAAGYFHARFEAPGVRRIVLEHRGDTATLADDASTGPFLHLDTDDSGATPRLLVRAARGEPWHALPSAASAPTDAYLISSGWPLPALHGRASYRRNPMATLRRTWTAGRAVQTTEKHGVLVTGGPTPLRLNLGPRLVPLQPTRLGFVAAALFYAALWSGLVGGAIWGRRRLRRRRGRCPRCAYDLRHGVAAGCPECGWGRAAGS